MCRVDVRGGGGGGELDACHSLQNVVQSIRNMYKYVYSVYRVCVPCVHVYSVCTVLCVHSV